MAALQLAKESCANAILFCFFVKYSFLHLSGKDIFENMHVYGSTGTSERTSPSVGMQLETFKLLSFSF